MTRHVALLYSVVISPQRRVKSAELREIAMECGLMRAKTVLSTGNVLFDSDLEAPQLEDLLHDRIRDFFGRSIAVFVRNTAAWRELVAENPFPKQSLITPALVCVRLMRHQPDAATIARISRSVGVDEHFAVTDRALWVAATDPMSGSPLTRAVNAAWAGEGTMRNASALAKITAALDD
jgi:uncharacterized protein (DUF1697 family)